MYISPAIPQFTPTPVPTTRTCRGGRKSDTRVTKQYDFLEYPFASLRNFIPVCDYLPHGFRLALALLNERRNNGAYLVVYFAQRAS